MMYKYLVILVLTTVALAAEKDLLGDSDKEKEQCIKELKLDAYKIRNLDDVEDIDDMDKMTKDERCVLRCVLEKAGAIDANGNLIPEELDEQIAKELNIDFSKCEPKKDIADPCEQAFVLTKCALKLILDATEKKS
ncbi:hypothetical protein Trydic_g23241 [Trypoxylus dichotomus]